MDVTRRDILAMSALAMTGSAILPSVARGQAPKRGGTLTVRGWDPPLFDPMLTTAYRVQIPLTFTHSRLVKHKAGPSIAPGTFAVEPDLAESWTQPNETTYVFKLRRGVRWHNKPPVNGRELTADDVRYSVERFLTVAGNPSAYMLRAVERVEPVDRYTVKFTLKEPFAWFLDMLANPMAVAIVAKEVVDKYGDLKPWESVIGTGPWMLDSYRPNIGYTYVRHPAYFVAGQPYIDRVEVTVDEDNASRTASFLAGKYDLGWELPGGIARSDWLQLRDTLKTKRPNLRVAEFPGNVGNHVSMRVDQKPFSDLRVRQAMSMALDRKALIDTLYEGSGVANPPGVPLALKDWSLPVDQLGDGAKNFAYDPKEAKRLLAAAGYPNGFPATICWTTYGTPIVVDHAQLVVKYFKDVGIDAKLDTKEYGAYISTCFYGKFDSLAFGPQTPFLDGDNYLFGYYYPGEMKNQSHVNDPVVADMLVRQRRTFDVGKRRELIHEAQRYLAKQVYYTTSVGTMYTVVWDGALKNYGPNLGYDYGGRLMAAWLDR